MRHRHHTIAARTAFVEQTNGAGTQYRGAAVEGSYSFVHPRASLAASIRRLPRVLPGIELPGSVSIFSARVRMTKALRSVARAYGAESLAFGRAQSTRTQRVPVANGSSDR